MTSPSGIGPVLSANSAELPVLPAPGFASAPSRPLASGPRVAVGILQALASGFVGVGWLCLTGLVLEFSSDSPRSDMSGFLFMTGAIGLVIALSGLGGIGTAATASRPMHDIWVRVWVWMSCLFGGLPVVILIALALWIQVLHA